jgi:hypothetical protein
MSWIRCAPSWPLSHGEARGAGVGGEAGARVRGRGSVSARDRGSVRDSGRSEEGRPLNPLLFFERETGFEPATSTLARWHSTTELLPHSLRARVGTDAREGLS